MSGGRATHLVHSLDNSYGGPARSVPELMHAMSEFGWCSEAISLKSRRSERNQVIEKYHLPWKIMNAQVHPYLAFNLDLTRSITAGKPDLVHYHNIWNYVPIAAWRAGKTVGCPVIMSPRGTLFAWNLAKGKVKKALYLKLFSDLLFDESAAVHATSAAEVEAVKALSKRTPVALIANGVDIGEFSDLSAKAVHKSNLELDVWKKHILYVGRIEEKKGLALLITAFAELLGKGVACELVVAGPEYSKSYADHCHSLARELGVYSSIKWLGMVVGDTRTDIYGAADLFVLPTQSENFGMAIAEALSAALPVITTVGTPWRDIEENNAGYIIEPDSQQLFLRMDEFFNLSPRSVFDMSLAAKAIAEMCGWKEPAQHMSHLYSWVLGNSEKPDFVY